MSARDKSARCFRFGVIAERMNLWQSAEAWATQARKVEALGYATLLMRDHFVPDFFGDQFAPLIALMAAANATQTLRIGTLVIDNDYRHPVMLAKEAATLDLLSNGRFELGLGAGWLQKEYEQAGMTFDANGVRVSRLEESVCVLKGLFAGEPFTFTGEHYRVANLTNFPKAMQCPHPPILIGAGSKRMLMLAGREANIVGLLTSSTRTGTLVSDPTERLAESVAQKIAWVRQGAGERFATIELSLLPDFIFTEQREQAAAELIRKRNWQGITSEQVLQMPAIFIGTVEQICEQMIQRREQFGFSYYVVDDETMEACAPIVARMRGR